MSLEINREVIADELIQDELNYVIKNLPHPPSEEEKSTLLETVKENLIYKTLLRQEAEKLDITIPVEYIEREYQLFVKSQSTPTPRTADEVKKMKTFITQKLKESALIESICQDLLTPTSAHLETFYNDNLEHYFIAKQYHYAYAGVKYKSPTHYQELYDALQKVISNCKNNQTEKSYNFNTNISIEYLRTMLQNTFSEKKFANSHPPQTVVTENKTNLPVLSQDGFSLLNHLASSYKNSNRFTVSKITDVVPDALLFNPIKDYETHPSLTANYQLGFYLLLNIRENFTPTFAEVAEQVKKDLREEMEQIKTRSFLRKVMEESSIKDISYL